VKRAAILRDPSISVGIGQFAVIQAVAPSVGVDVKPVNIQSPDEIERAVASIRAIRKRRYGRDSEHVGGVSSRFGYDALEAEWASYANRWEWERVWYAVVLPDKRANPQFGEHRLPKRPGPPMTLGNMRELTGGIKTNTTAPILRPISEGILTVRRLAD
jgi:hypothetical protein